MMHEQSFFPLFGAFGWIAIALLVGVILRAKVGFLQKFLVPAAIIAGILGFILKSTGVIQIDYDTFTLFAIHFFTLNFISVGLTGTEDAVKPDGTSVRKVIFKGVMWMAIVALLIQSLQTIIGMGVIIATNMFGEPLWEGLGYLLSVGYTQGPGQAVAIASIWEGNYKVAHAVSIGLTFAAVGFLVSALVGVPLAKWGLKKGLAAHRDKKDLPEDFLVGLHRKNERPTAGEQTTHSANVDALAFQVAVLMTTYFITYFVTLGIKAAFPAGLKGLAFGLMFIWGMIIAVMARAILKKMGVAHYLDNNVQRRITGMAVDFMVVSTLMAIKVATLWTFFVPILISCVLGALVTFYVMLYFGRRLEHNSLERMVALFGILTGTVASGLLLLRIVDPDFKTTTVFEVAMYSVPQLVLLPLVFFYYTMPNVGWIFGLGISGGAMLVALILLKFFGVWKQKAW
jgi:glutamate:Na+ symporter, ESS family